jgi:CheY-like chemotaxis protein
VRAYTARVHRAALRAKEITRNLLSFTGMQGGEQSAADLNKVVGETLGLVEREYRTEGVEIVTAYGALPETVMDPVQVGQVFLNLLINARHALLGVKRKRITIATGATVDSVWLKVTDTGCGIAQEDLSRVFTPFFTTKGEHSSPGSPQSQVKGTGLGLSISHTIATQHKGSLQVESHRGQGSTFVFSLPLRKMDALPEAAAPPLTSYMGAGRCVLILDDEPEVCAVAESMLTRAGYQTVCTDDGEQALAHIRAGGIDLVLVDLQMPKMSSIAFLHELDALSEERSPRCLVMTGRQMEQDADRAVLAQHEIIAKPFVMEELFQKIHAVLS